MFAETSVGTREGLSGVSGVRAAAVVSGMRPRRLWVRHRCMERGEGGGGEKSCDTASGSELIFQIYLSGNGLEPSEPLQMALGELEWNGWERWGTAELYCHSSLHMCRPCFGPFSFLPNSRFVNMWLKRSFTQTPAGSSRASSK